MKKLFSLLSTLLIMLTVMCNAGFVADATTEKEIINETIKKYYELSYDMWWNLEEKSFENVLDMDSIQAYNKTVAMKESIFSWKYSLENGYYEGQREKNKVKIKFIETKIIDDTTAKVAVDLMPEKDNAVYPFFISLGENYFVLKNKNGNWLISEHKYMDTYCYEKSLTQKIYPNYEAIVNSYTDNGISNNTINLVEEIRVVTTPYAYPYTDYNYNAKRAVAYANNFCLNRNIYFYDASSDCTNFVSQCVSYGFGNTTGYSTPSSYRMVNTGAYNSGWFAGPNGGSASWENVDRQWTYMFSAKTNSAGPRVKTVTISTMQNGDIMQIDFNSDGDYDHSCILVDATTQKFAQHTGNKYNYLADYGGTKRLYRPRFFRVY